MNRVVKLGRCTENDLKNLLLPAPNILSSWPHSIYLSVRYICQLNILTLYLSTVLKILHHNFPIISFIIFLRLPWICVLKNIKPKFPVDLSPKLMFERFLKGSKNCPGTDQAFLGCPRDKFYFVRFDRTRVLLWQKVQLFGVLTFWISSIFGILHQYVLSSKICAFICEERERYFMQISPRGHQRRFSFCITASESLDFSLELCFLASCNCQSQKRENPTAYQNTLLASAA